MHVVVATYGTTGDVQPLIALTKELCRRGHACKFAAPPNFGPRVLELGLEFVPLGPPYDMGEFRDVYGRAFLSSDPVQHVRRTLPLAIRDAPQMISELSRACAGADVLISMPYQLAGAIVHELLGIPLISTNVSPFGGYSRRFAAECARLINELRAAYGLGNVSDPLGPKCSSSLLTVYSVSPAVFPRPHSWPESHHLAGFFFLDEDYVPDPALAHFVASGEPPVVISFGSMVHVSPEELSAIVADALRQVGRRAIVQRGWTDLRFDAVPDRIHVVDFVPHAWLFPRAACVVHSGGSGTTGATLRAGVPSIVVPHMLDQFIWATLLLDLRCSAETIPYTELGSDRLATAIRRALDPCWPSRIAEISARVAGENGVSTAADLIEAHVTSGDSRLSLREDSHDRPGQ